MRVLVPSLGRDVDGQNELVNYKNSDDGIYKGTWLQSIPQTSIEDDHVASTKICFELLGSFPDIAIGQVIEIGIKVHLLQS